MVLVCDNAATLDSLKTYLERAGVTTVCARKLERIPSVLGDALVVFPDDFAFEEVLRTVEAQASSSRELLIMLVTAQPKRYSERLRSSALDRLPLVIPRPAWGFTILDAMRAHFDRAK